MGAMKMNVMSWMRLALVFLLGSLASTGADVPTVSDSQLEGD